MQTVQSDGTKVFGLYELSSNGTILYSRARVESELREPTPENVGQDFFYDVASFKNTADLRQHFRRFITGDRSFDAFIFDCLYESEIVRTKVSMTRGHETDIDGAGEIVILDIRKEAG